MGAAELRTTETALSAQHRAQTALCAGSALSGWLPQDWAVVQGDFLLVEEFEVLFFVRGRVDAQGIGIALAQEADVVGVLQIFDASGIAAQLPVVMLNGAHVGGAAMHHFFFAVAANLLGNIGEHDGQGEGDHRQGQHERDHHVTALGGL